MKEYWGFYLLANSYFRLQTCSRHEGASVVIIKHSKNVERCAWLGELDSAEESDEISNEFDFEQEVLNEVEEQTDSENTTENDKIVATETPTDLILSDKSEEMPQYVKVIGNWSDHSQKTILKMLLRKYLSEQPSDTKADTALKELDTNEDETNKHEMDENSEEFDTPDYMLGNLKSRDFATDNVENIRVVDHKHQVEDEEVDHFFHNGKFNQKNRGQNKKDRSNEEVRSSWSSSEESLAACEGAIFNVPLNGATKCNENTTFSEMRSIMSNISYIVDTTGFYYFIFSNENEITSNFVAANFDMHKTVFDVTDREEECFNTTDCSLPLSFLSHQHVVIEVPQQGSETCEYDTEGFTSYQQCNSIVTAESICEPRGSIYFLFLLLVPIFILVFAYV